MIRLLLKSLLFIIPLAILFRAQESVLSKYPNCTTVKKKNFEKNLKNIRTLILGSSYSMYGINPEYFDHAFNLANVSQSFYYDYELLKKYIDSLPRLKTIIIPFSYFSLGFNLFDAKERFRCFIYKKYWDIDFPENRFYFPGNYSYLSIYDNKYAVNCVLGRTRSEVNENGYYCYSEVRGDPRNSAERISYVEKNFYRKKNITNNINYLRGIIALSSSKGIKVIFVELPVHTSYADLMKPEIEKHNDSVLETFLNEAKGVIVLNYLRDKRFDVTDFSDCDHLNCNGSNKMSGILSKDIISSDADYTDFSRLR